MAFSLNIANFFKPSEPDAPANAPESESLDNADKRISAKKTELLKQVSDEAAARGQRPTLESYRQAAERFAATDEGKALFGKHNWAPIMADLRDQKLDGFTLIDPLKARDREIPENVKRDLDPQTLKLIEDMRQQKEEEEKVDPNSHEARAHTDTHNLDGDGKINSHAIHGFYVQFGDVSNSYVWPATSYNKELADAKHLENVTFDGMQLGDKFAFGKGHHHKITLTNINGGELAFHGSNIHELHMEGAKVTTITMDKHTYINELHAEGASIVTFNAEKGAKLDSAHFQGATIGMESKMHGMVLTNVEFIGTNLAHVDLSHTHMKNVDFKGSTLTGTDLSHANLEGANFTGSDMHDLNLSHTKLKDIRIDGQAIQNTAQLKSVAKEHGIAIDDHTHVSASPEFLAQAKKEEALAAVNAIKQQAFGWKEELNNSPAESKPMLATEKPAAKPEPNMSKAELTKFYSPNQGRA